MAAISATMTAITEMVRERMEAFPLDVIVGQPPLNSVRYLLEHLTTFERHFATKKWGGKHGFLPLVLREAKIRISARDKNLNFNQLAKPELLDPKIEDYTKGRDILQLQEDQKVECQKYTFQEVVDSVAVKAIVTDVDAQYIKDLEEDYVRYKNQTIKRCSCSSVRGM